MEATSCGAIEVIPCSAVVSIESTKQQPFLFPALESNAPRCVPSSAGKKTTSSFIHSLIEAFGFLVCFCCRQARRWLCWRLAWVRRSAGSSGKWPTFTANWTISSAVSAAPTTCPINRESFTSLPFWPFYFYLATFLLSRRSESQIKNPADGPVFQVKLPLRENLIYFVGGFICMRVH